MLIETLRTLFNRDLNKLKQEIGLYISEPVIWHYEKGIANSAGNLCLHLVGNLKTYIGAELGQHSYVRNRELEFSAKDVPRADLLQRVEETIVVLNDSLGKLTEDELQKEYPILVFAEKTSTEYFLVHLAAHLAYHLGQINYHRRLLDEGI
ncbi:DUF1572 family protein [Hymenobacter sp. GOD-10R]|uniref:DUF1572 family protein n=1 Tax=Hymenobacter sp. GOD-10R TaxID=3093922 RepID=UPI002D7827AF|nr:DUF1572 family protein [Hymenobacter sp. GOD-10R]WRQ26394.1 DUF1572 family protein [Hymenobacter sp. GOD-10R]